MQTEAHQANAERIHETLGNLNRARRADFIAETPILVNGVSVRRKVKAVWAVWEKSGPWPPQKFHHTRGAAEVEAANLAALNPGKKYLVAQLETKFYACAGQIIEDLTYINYATNRDEGMTPEAYASMFRDFPKDAYEARYQSEQVDA